MLKIENYTALEFKIEVLADLLDEYKHTESEGLKAELIPIIAFYCKRVVDFSDIES